MYFCGSCGGVRGFEVGKVADGSTEVVVHGLGGVTAAAAAKRPLVSSTTTSLYDLELRIEKQHSSINYMEMDSFAQ